MDYEADAEMWASGKLRHTDDCQINKTPPTGWPFDGFSCNCNGVLVDVTIVEVSLNSDSQVEVVDDGHS